ncbi:MAG: glycoside hydrolase family 9 protein [Prevotella sp.]|nr:glycoside hydrolase family 9 protein [Prevotella sp.]
MKHVICSVLLSVVAGGAIAQNPIKVNQVGYGANEEKIAVIEPQVKAKSFVIKDAKGRKVWSGKANIAIKSPFNDKVRRQVDFSRITTPGTYTLYAGKHSQQVIISQNPNNEVAAAALKAFYLQRTAMPIEEKYAGAYARPMAHPDNKVIVHPSAASASRPAGTVISSLGGWYDAGDYNKYIVNSAFTIGMMLQAYQLNKDYFDAMDVNIPESGNGVADLLDEVMYNIKWMMTMQDPEDGGVYHKLTTPNFEGFVMPKECAQPRYVVQKSTQAALDFAATMALAARIYAQYPSYQSFCREAVDAAERAYAWAVKNPNVIYDQPGNNDKYDPDVFTGMYDDKQTGDEFFWAATELYLTTHQSSYLAVARLFVPTKYAMPTWGDVSGLAIHQWLNQEILKTCDAQTMAIYINKVKESLKEFCNADISALAQSCYHSVFGNKASDFVWGSNSEMCAGRGIALMYEHALSGDDKYRRAALTALDHLFGRNATGYCYVTGFGTQRVMNPHQRISAADGVADPMPGFLAGGANSGKQDAEYVPAYADSPDECYQDHVGSYASNEIAINWNAYLVSLLSMAKY